MHGRTAGNIEADNTGNRVKRYDGITQAPRNGVLRLDRGNDFGRREDHDRTEKESGDCRDDTNMYNLGKMDVRDVIVERRDGDDDQVQCGERV